LISAQVALRADESGRLLTCDGVEIACVAPADPPLAPGELARFRLVDGGSGLVAAFDRRCSPKRALADSASKVAFFHRHRSAGGLSIGAVRAAAAGALG